MQSNFTYMVQGHTDVLIGPSAAFIAVKLFILHGEVAAGTGGHVLFVLRMFLLMWTTTGVRTVTPRLILLL